VCHRTVSGAPEDSNTNSSPSGNSRGNSAIIHRTVRCSKEERPQELASFGNSFQLLRYNSPDCPVYTGLSGVHRTVSGAPRKSGLRNSPPSGIHFSYSAIIHRTVRCTPDCPVYLRDNGYFSANGYLQRIYCAPVRAEVRRAHAGAPDTLQYMSGAPPDIQAGPEVRAPTVRTQRLW
jgi:hypothetical protein